MTERKPQRNRRGFTLTEVLLALAILIILLALAMIPISRHQRPVLRHLRRQKHRHLCRREHPAP